MQTLRIASYTIPPDPFLGRVNTTLLQGKPGVQILRIIFNEHLIGVEPITCGFEDRRSIRLS